MLLPFSPVAMAASSSQHGHTGTPNAYSCSSWVVVVSKQVSHKYGVATYAGDVYLEKLIDSATGSYCNEIRAEATLTTPTGALSATVRADLSYEPSGSGNFHDTYGPTLTAGSGASVYSVTASESNVSCALARGYYVFPDTSATYATAQVCGF